MKYNDFIENIPSDIATKLNLAYSKTKILTTNHKKELDDYNKKLVNKLLQNYDVIINSLNKINLKQFSSITINIIKDFNYVLNTYSLNYKRTRKFSKNKTDILNLILTNINLFLSLLKLDISFTKQIQTLLNIFPILFS